MADVKPITVKELIERLKKMPQDLPIVSCSDDEGNDFRYVYCVADIGLFSPENRDFIGEDSYEEDKDYYSEFNGAPKAVCIS